MKKLFVILMVAVGFVFGSNMVFAAEKAPQEVVDLANTEMAKLGSDPEIVKAVKAQNAKGMTMDQIKAINEKWEDAKDTDDIVKAVIGTEFAKYLKKTMESNPALKKAEEIYVMDKQGALVGSAKLEEDYWWGENEGFIVASKGKVYVSDFILDEDENEYMIHVMVPVKDDGQVIGAIDIGVEVED